MSAIAVASSIASIAEKLKNVVNQWEKEKNIQRQAASFLKDDADNYVQLFGEISSLAQTELMPIIEEIKEIPSKTQIDLIVAHATEVQLKFAELLRCFIRLAKDGSQIAKNEAFMGELMKANGMLYDYVRQLNAAYAKEDSVKIGEDYFAFFKLYRKQLSKKMSNTEVESAIQKGKAYLQLIRKKILPYLKATSISRENKKRFTKSYEALAKVTRKVQVTKASNVELMDYVLPQLVPIIVLVEEIVSDTVKRLKLQKFQKLHVTKGKHK